MAEVFFANYLYFINNFNDEKNESLAKTMFNNIGKNYSKYFANKTVDLGDDNSRYFIRAFVSYFVLNNKSLDNIYNALGKLNIIIDEDGVNKIFKDVKVVNRMKME